MILFIHSNVAYYARVFKFTKMCKNPILFWAGLGQILEKSWNQWKPNYFQLYIILQCSHNINPAFRVRGNQRLATFPNL